MVADDGTIFVTQSAGERVAIVRDGFVDEMVDQAMNAGKWSNGHNGFVTDLLNCALGEIDYHEIAEHYEEELEDV